MRGVVGSPVVGFLSAIRERLVDQRGLSDLAWTGHDDQVRRGVGQPCEKGPQVRAAVGEGHRAVL